MRAGKLLTILVFVLAVAPACSFSGSPARPAPTVRADTTSEAGPAPGAPGAIAPGVAPVVFGPGRTISGSPVSPSRPVALPAGPVTTHPRLWIRQEDLPRLRAWAVPGNPVYGDGLAQLATDARATMDAGTVPKEDTGSTTWEQYPVESYAELFAFMSLIDPDANARADYARRAPSSCTRSTRRTKASPGTSRTATRPSPPSTARAGGGGFPSHRRLDLPRPLARRQADHPQGLPPLDR